MTLLWVLLLVFSVLVGGIQILSVLGGHDNLLSSGRWIWLTLAVVGFYFACHNLHLLGL